MSIRRQAAAIHPPRSPDRLGPVWALANLLILGWLTAGNRAEGQSPTAIRDTSGNRPQFLEPTSERRDGHPGRSFALLVGIGNYHHAGLPDLPGAEPDIVGLQSVLIDNGFATDRVIVLTNREGARDPRRLPNAANIRRYLQSMALELNDQDSLWIALAGHGLQRSAIDYDFCPNDANPQDPSSLIALSEIYAVLANCRSKFKFLLVDACREGLAGRIAGVGLGLQNIPEPPANTVAFFSCAAGQLAYERQEGQATQGVFFHAVIRGLQGAAAGPDGLVTLPDLERFVKKDVQAYVQKTFAASQHPTIRNNTVGLPPLLESSVADRQVQQVIDLWHRQQRAEAHKYLGRLLEAFPTSAAAWAQQARMLADDYEQRSDDSLWEQATRAAERAIELAPHRAAGFLARANLQRIRQDHVAMLSDCDRAIAVEPHCPLAYAFRAVAYRLLDQPELVGQDIRRATERPISCPLTSALIAGCYFGLAEADRGFQILDQAIILAPDVPMLHFMQGYGRDQIGAYDQAILSYTAALRLDPSDDELLLRRAVSLARVGDRPAALADLQAAERLRPDRSDLATIRQFVQQTRLGQAQRPARAGSLQPNHRSPNVATQAQPSNRIVPQVIAN